MQSPTTLPHSRTSVLDEALGEIESGEIKGGLETLVAGLRDLRGNLSHDEWRKFAVNTCRNHPVKNLVHQDPLTKRSFEKPRGYPGDAVILDLMYASDGSIEPPIPAETTPLGKQIYFDYTSQAPEPRAVCARKRILKEFIGEAARRKQEPHILSVACGHLREAQESAVVLEGKVGRYVALDLDAECLAEVDRALGKFGITTMHAHIKDIVQGNLPLSNFDLIYAAGLYDYLETPFARTLTEKTFNMLNPGGHFLTANVLPESKSRGYSEAYMDWWLIHRNEEQMFDLASSIPSKQIQNVRTFVEENNTIAFLEIEKRD